MADDIMTLYDEDENPIKFQFLDYIEYDHAKYVALLPLEGAAANSEVLIMQVVEDEKGNQDFDLLTDKKLIRKLYNQFKRDHKEEYDFRD